MERNKLKHASFFSGMGGFDLASEWMGWENKLHCEISNFCKQILKYYWPNATCIGDITQANFSFWRNRIDVLTGGFPCQPYSLAGKRKGKDDTRHLWPQMLRAIREIAPIYVVGENVNGLVNWNGGMVFEEVQADLENEGYEVMPVILPAASVNAPHKRERIWFIAYSHANANVRKSRRHAEKSKEKRIQEWDKIRKSNESDSLRGFLTNTKSITRGEGEKQNANANKWKAGEYKPFNRHEVRSTIRPDIHVTNSDGLRLWGQSDRERESRFFSKEGSVPNWDNFPTQSPICNGNDGISSRLDIGTILKVIKRKVTKAFKAYNWWRKESLKAGGNAIVPQVAFEIFKVIQKMEDEQQ